MQEEGIIMLERIANILKEISSKLDLETLKKIVDIVIEEEHLDLFLSNKIIPIDRDYAKEKLSFSDLQYELFKAAYYVPNKAIYVNWDNIIESSKVENLEESTFLDEKRKIDFFNLNLLFYFLHEMEHVNQMQKNTGLEGSILNACSSSENNDTYAISPKERFANIYAFCQIIEIAKMMKMPNTIILYFERRLKHNISNTYIWIMKDNEGPTNVYFRMHNNLEMIINYEESLEKYPLIERLIYGLPISKIEYEDLIRGRIYITSDHFQKYLQKPIDYNRHTL